MAGSRTNVELNQRVEQLEAIIDRQARLTAWCAMPWHDTGQWQVIGTLACGMCQVQSKCGQGKA
ncbi:hypothetical protein RND71_030748 [Anisodus tanguticus]|uniref:Uncharacterized protein n=1 Tax=Anisodus tanguticus TaxID=243964 RepID=A0AAE1RH01_9SOLA|nr:hypothetical protein RND71_030748 [Anisodus tanguticus]